MRCRQALVSRAVGVVAVGMVASGSAWAGGVRFTTVMATGQAAPGFGAGATISANGLGVAGSNAAGQVPFDATVVGPGLPVDGVPVVYRWTDGALDLIAFGGEPAPQLGTGATFGSVGSMSILPDGAVAYAATTAGTGGGIVPPEQSMWVQSPGPAVGGALRFWLDR